MTHEKLISLIEQNNNLNELKLSQNDLANFENKLHSFDADNSIYNKGDRALSIFLLISGSVQLKNNSEEKIISEKEFFGTDAVLNNSIRKYDASAVEKSFALELLLYSDDEVDQRIRAGQQPTEKSKTDNYPDLAKLSLQRNMNKKFEHKQLESITVVFVNVRKATLEHSKKFKEYLSELIEAGSTNLVVDLRETNLIDSTFLGVLVTKFKDAKKKNGDIRLVYNSDNPSALFVMTYMDKVFKTFSDIELAIKSF